MLVQTLSVVAVLGFTAVPAAAAGPVDQQQLGGGYGLTFGIWFDPSAQYSMFELAQTFTAGTTGELDQLELSLTRGVPNEPPPEQPVTVELRTADAGGPTETVLASATVPAELISDGAPTLVPVPIGPVSVTAGSAYAIVVRGDGKYHWTFGFGQGSDLYPGGTMYERNITTTGGVFAPFCPEASCDFVFRTFVTPTAPQLRPCTLLDLPFVLLQRLLRLPAYCA